MSADYLQLVEIMRSLPAHTATTTQLARSSERSILTVATDIRRMTAEGIVEYTGEATYRLKEQRLLWQ